MRYVSPENSDQRRAATTGDEPLAVQGTEETEMLGPYWVVGRFEADMMGTPIIGQPTTGYDHLH